MTIDSLNKLKQFLSGRVISIKFKIFLLLLVVIFPIAALETSDILKSRRTQIETSQANLLSLAKEGASRYLEIVSKATALLDTLKEIPIVQLEDMSTCVPFLKNIAKQKSWVVAVGIADINGNSICGSSSRAGPHPNFADRPYFQQALTTVGPVVSDLVFSRISDPTVSGKPIFVVAEALRNPPGEAYAVLSVAVDVNWASKLAERIGQQADGSVLLIDRQGVVLTQSSRFSYHVGTGIAAAPGIANVLAGTEGTLEAPAPDGTVQLVGYASIASAGVKILVSQPKSVVVAAADARFMENSLEFLAALVIAAVLAWAAAEIMLLRWIAKLARAAERLGSGDFATRCQIPTSAGEFSVVGRALDAASVRLGLRDAEMHQAEAALRASEARYRILAENSSDMVTLKTSFNGARSYVSPASRTLVGWEPEEFITVPIDEYVHPDDLKRVEEEYRGLTPEQPKVVSVHRVRHKSGHWVWVESVLQLMAAGTAEESVVLTARDISARMSAELALQESEARYRLLIENATDMVFRLDTDFVRRYVSPACKEILGYEVEELIDRKPVNMVHPDDAAEVARVYATVVAGVDRAEVVNRIRHKDGHWVWVEAELRALRDPLSNSVIGILGALRDISDRKHAEVILEASEARFKMLAENTVDLITHIGPDGKRTFASPASRILLGFEPEELLGGHPSDLAHPDDWSTLKNTLEDLASGLPTSTVQYRARRKDGSYLWVEASGRLLENGQGTVLAIRDIDRRKLAEDELDKLILQLKTFAHLDGLTSIANRRSFDETIDREIKRAGRTGAPISLILADVDNFKAYNDNYGHLEGDECLKSIANALQVSIRRPGDLAARYGGEEFAAILADTTEEGAIFVAEAFRSKVASSLIPHARSSLGIVTVSVGVVTVVPGPGKITAFDLIQKADKALYAAKSAGKNRVQFEGMDVKSLPGQQLKIV